ncbi:phospholipase D domain protein [Natronomonas moolapensis 8.8.11]|uniref:Phospholipase D domain protein n=1 Tax=Natronomonas moolapensis (strain DSM 18674 / CECT 7526 / JCM 14361 / 8.8.11) TaxID=268739 RepID=M1XKK4_NATM8|nr:phospholipase D-like domain-containing protein [Natronomonas moolapensis]CCQ36058.1 phospholipase D domain protein [Natronomonas moolapensis 8.8.11]
MLGRIAAALVVVLALSSGVAGAVPDATATATPTPSEPSVGSANATLVAAYPNPVAHDDRGEFVAVRFERPTNTTGWTLTDGTTTAGLPNRTVEGTVAFATVPERARSGTDYRVAPLSGRLRLANGGDRLALSDGNDTVSTARYRSAPESEIREFGAGVWRPVGATDHDPIRTDGGAGTAFVLPDAPNQAVETLASADERIRLAGYTFTSERITAALLEAAAEGVGVSVLLDGAPVGGITDRQAGQLDQLAEGGVDVRLLSGPHLRYRHHHPKYAVVDDRALVLTENFKPAGTGGASSRGWGVVLEDASAADALASVHRADWTWRAATPWREYRRGRDFVDGEPALGSFGTRHEPKRIDVDSATVLVTPDNAGTALHSRIEAAEDRLLIQQVRIDSRENDLLRAALRAAERGVRVRIHLGGSWYVEEDNAALVAWLNRRAEREGWDLEAVVDDPDPDGYGKIHTKGVIVDDTAVVGSLNWVESATTENREVLVALESAGAADYYASVFRSDWSGGSRPIPGGLLAAAAVAGSGGLLALRRLEFVGREGTVTDWRW